ncbi:hypothetical protein PAESOLCIP111_01325 [Paenibacillus solanacearum]|uniref:Uncharacterized protein n=1 Tax=Paenibacillus solanacearum TaxID=2048548 RepID=A0A916NN60_9BACL|nr:hypothetical protein [Paenibacillus solanacearum]CAG7611053.1 hypothetical protein PAESOLCIP111_01325 [Paenibacillus solanacearum]
MKTKKVGAPDKYSDEILQQKLNEFLISNTVAKLNYSSLAKETGIPRHVWMRRMSKVIQNIKEPTPKFFGEVREDLILPNIPEIIDKNWNNRNQMIKDLMLFEKIIRDLYQKSRDYEKFANEKEKMSEKIKKLEGELKLAKADVDYYKNELYKVSIKSKKTSERLNNNLQNVLEITPSKPETIEKATSGEFGKYFEGLFDKE